MFAIRLITLTAMLLLAACGAAGSSGVGQAGGAAETRPIGWDMLDASVDPGTTAGAFVATSSNSCDDAGNCVSRD